MIPASGAGGREFDSRITPFSMHSSLGVEHSRSKRKVVGLNPACDYSFVFFCFFSVVTAEDKSIISKYRCCV
jgi:hypothetical protein